MYERTSEYKSHCFVITTFLLHKESLHNTEHFKGPIHYQCVTLQLVAGQSEAYWDRFWSASGLTTDDFFDLITPEEIRNLRDNASGNLTTLCFKVRRGVIPARDSEILTYYYCSSYSDCHWLHPPDVLVSMNILLVWDHMIHLFCMYRIRNPVCHPFEKS